MTSGAPWSVKGIDPKAREIAKDLARRSGMTLGEWLNQMIFEDREDSGAETPRLALVRPVSESRPPRRAGDDLETVLAALQDLSQRFDASVEEQAETSERFQAALGDLRTDQAKVADRLRNVEQSGGGAGEGGSGRVEALKALEGALNKVATHLHAGESRQREAMVSLRRELGDEIDRVADDVHRKVADVENRSADAIAQVGAEVTRVAQTVELRLRRADDGQAEALERLGGEIARITERLSERIAAAERRAAESIDGVGQQIARVTDRLHQRQDQTVSELVDRMRQSEERTAKLLEGARGAIDRSLARREPAPAEDAASTASGAFAFRWSPTDVTPEPLAEPAAGVEAREPVAEPVEVAAEGESDVPAVAAHDEPLVSEEPRAPAFLEPPALILTRMSNARAPHQEPARTAPAFKAYSPTVSAEPAAPDDEAAFKALADEIEAGHDAEAAVLDTVSEDHAEPLEAHTPPVDAAQTLAAEADPLEDVEHDDGQPVDERPRQSTSEMIAEARASARVVDYPAFEADDELEFEAMLPDAAARTSRKSSPVRGALLAGGAVAFSALAASGYIALHPELLRKIRSAQTSAASKPIPVGPASAPAQAHVVAPVQATAVPARPPPPAQASIALADQPVVKDDPADMAAMFRAAVAKVDANDPAGVAPLRNVADLGYAPAQRRLGKLYEDGGAGLAQDFVEGRRWTQRAAANGDPRGMHNLGLDYYEGSGGIKNAVVAAQWFQRAAELGLRDSQFNLARFFEAGIGVKQNLATAYKWYLIAGHGGDTEAVTRGDNIKASLSPDDRGKAERAAAAFHPDPVAPPASTVAVLKGANAKQLALAQRALGKLGYYRGPDDGAASQPLGEALQAYQRDRGLADNGQLSPELVQTFAHIVQ